MDEETWPDQKKTTTNTKTKTKTKTMTKTTTFREHLQRAILETCDIWDTDKILTIENLNWWQSLWSDNWEWHWTAFAILAMFIHWKQFCYQELWQIWSDLFQLLDPLLMVTYLGVCTVRSGLHWFVQLPIAVDIWLHGSGARDEARAKSCHSASLKNN